MNTKLNPSPDDCYVKALPDEPRFTLLARDPSAPDLIDSWADQRRSDIARETRPWADMAQVRKARECAKAMRTWRQENYGRWQKASPLAFEEQFAPRMPHGEIVREQKAPKVCATTGAPPRPNLAPGPWVHYKWNAVYDLMHLALHEGTGEWMVVHMNRQTMNIFVRPVSEWTQIVETLDGRRVPRFREPDQDFRKAD